jgi:MoaA/NifB/PqqE/SkfB family radical SAM enzyme
VLPYKPVRPAQRGLMFEKLEHCCCTFSKAFIDSSLKVYPCYYSANADTCYGDLKRDSFRNIWNSGRLQDIREASRQRPLCEVSMFRPDVPHKYRGRDLTSL